MSVGSHSIISQLMSKLTVQSPHLNDQTRAHYRRPNNNPPTNCKPTKPVHCITFIAPSRASPLNANDTKEVFAGVAAVDDAVVFVRVELVLVELLSPAVVLLVLVPTIACVTNATSVKVPSALRTGVSVRLYVAPNAPALHPVYPT